MNEDGFKDEDVATCCNPLELEPTCLDANPFCVQGVATFNETMKLRNDTFDQCGDRF